MNAQDLVELSDRMIAFDSLMKGNFKKEVAEAKAALDNLKLGKDLCLVRNQLQDAKEQFEKYKAKIDQEHKAQISNLVTRNEDISRREVVLQQEILGVKQSQQTLLNHRDEHELQKEAHVRHVLSADTTLNKRQEALDTMQAELNRDLADMAEREQALARKLEMLKAI